VSRERIGEIRVSERESSEIGMTERLTVRDVTYLAVSQYVHIFILKGIPYSVY
jgi:hypothetical protein